MLDDFDLQIEPGQKVLLAGPSGSGKSTLLRAIAGLLLTADSGDLSGSVAIDGQDPRQTPGQVGLLLQDPSAAVVARRVGRDVAFGLENTRVPRGDMPALVRRALAAARFPYDEQRLTNTLSGGETQRLALAGALALAPRVLLLDEPTAMLDRENAARVRESVLAACEAAGTTLVVVEHHLGPWLEHMDRCLVLDAEGRLVADGSAVGTMTEHTDVLASQGIWVPGVRAPEPESVPADLLSPGEPLPLGSVLAEATEVAVRHRSPFADGARHPGTVALAGVDCAVEAGRALTLTGASGAGKSTLLAVLAGLQKPDSGRAEIHERFAGRRGRSLHRLRSTELARHLAWVPQLPQHGVVKHQVLDELTLTARALGQQADEAEERALALLEVLGMTGLENAHTHHLSGGEQRRLVVAAALVHRPSVVLLDEPTVGQDRNTWAAVMGLCTAAVAAGTGLAVASHDRDATDLLEPLGSAVRLELGRVVGEAA